MRSAESHEVQLLVDLEQLATILALSRTHTFRLYKSGQLPTPIKFGTSVRWHRKGIENWLAAGAPDANEWTRRQAHTASATEVEP